MRKLFNYFSLSEICLWIASVFLIVISFLLFDRENHLTLLASLIGVTSLIFNAKGNPFGQFLMVIFSLLYGIISYTFSYYGEMITYLGMTMPMAIFALVSWLKNPYQGNRAEVKINSLSFREIIFMWAAAGIVTVIFSSFWMLSIPQIQSPVPFQSQQASLPYTLHFAEAHISPLHTPQMISY